MDHMTSHTAPCSAEVNDDHLVSRLWELSQDSTGDNAELESLEAIVYQRLLQTYGDDITAPLDA